MHIVPTECQKIEHESWGFMIGTVTISREGLQRSLKSEIEFYRRKMAVNGAIGFCVGCNTLAIGTEQTLICSFFCTSITTMAVSRDKVWNEIDNGGPGLIL